MKILLEVTPELNAAYRAIARDRKVPVTNLYAATLRDALDADLPATVAEVAPRKPRARP